MVLITTHAVALLNKLKDDVLYLLHTELCRIRRVPHIVDHHIQEYFVGVQLLS